ncbi:MAG: Recombination protein RecR, partial [Candidatus Falkowbacteria bacterium GW2011_GWF2_39_8]
EGETTTLYLTKLIKPYQIKITRLAKGLPMGADLEYIDELTLSNALKYRNEL